MASDVNLYEYHGPRARIVALDLEIEAGEQVYGPGSLESVVGFTKVSASKASDSKLINEKDTAKEAVASGATVGSGEQTEADH